MKIKIIIIVINGLKIYKEIKKKSKSKMNSEGFEMNQINSIKLQICNKEILYCISYEDKYLKQIKSLDEKLGKFYKEYYGESDIDDDEYYSDEEEMEDMWDRLDYLEWLYD